MINFVRNNFDRIINILGAAMIVGLLTWALFHPNKAQAGELWGVATLTSYHTDRSAGYNEHNHGAGLQYDINKDWTLSVGEYRNSFNRKSEYFGFAYTPFYRGNFKAGVTVLDVSGYTAPNFQSFTPMAVPLIVWQNDALGIGVNTIFVPPVQKHSGVLGFQVKFRLDAF